MKFAWKILSLSLLAAAPATADDIPPDFPDFPELDRNRNGVVTQEEARWFIDMRSRAADFNRSGNLSPSEIAAAAPGMNERQAANYIELMDRDGDNELSYDEMAQDLPMLFRIADRDQDGLISPAEYVQAASRLGN